MENVYSLLGAAKSYVQALKTQGMVNFVGVSQ